MFHFLKDTDCLLGFPAGTSGKEPTCQCRRCRRLGFDLWVGKSPEEGNGNPLQYSCLENPRDRGAWWAIVHGVTKVGEDWTTKQQQQFYFSYPCFLPVSLSLGLCYAHGPDHTWVRHLTSILPVVFYIVVNMVVLRQSWAPLKTNVWVLPWSGKS